MGSPKSILWFFSCLIGLAGFGIIVTEILKKWQIIGKTLSPVWIIAPIWLLFIVKKVPLSPFLIDRLHLSPKVVKRATSIINIIWIIFAIGAVISLPFLWYGVIKELAMQGHK